MSKFFSERFANLEPYVPGEQPHDKQYLKLNTNESPFPPQHEVVEAAREASRYLNKYSDPDNRKVTEAIAAYYGLGYENVLVTNGSDEALNFAFLAFADEKRPLVFPEITYGFYPVAANVNHIPYETLPVGDDLLVNYKDYCGIGKNVVLANPNAPTGVALPLNEIEEIVRTNPDNIVIVDEAYVDFGAESAVALIPRYRNLLVTQTFSKSRSLAGGRLGFIMGSEALIADMVTLKYAINPYNVNSMTAAAGMASIADDTHFKNSCKAIMFNRDVTVEGLEARGFTVIPSKANFVFARAEWVEGGELYARMKEKGVLIRHFTNPKISDYNRISIGNEHQMEDFLDILDDVYNDMKKEGELREDQ